jgi:CheY-like chemotaxis protein
MSSNESGKSFEVLRARYAASLASKRRALALARDAFDANPADASSRRELTLQLHRLAGSAMAYGYEDLGARARGADELLRNGRTPAASNPAHAGTLGCAIHAVLDELDRATIRASARVGESAPLNIVLVEDDPAQAMLTAAELRAQGCVIRLASDADALRKLLMAWPCHAIVLDYWLRGESADEIASALRRDPRFASIALVCYSQERDQHIQRSALAAGCDAAIGKHEGSARLLAAVRACVMRPDRAGGAAG